MKMERFKGMEITYNRRAGVEEKKSRSVFTVLDDLAAQGGEFFCDPQNPFHVHSTSNPDTVKCVGAIASVIRRNSDRQ